jgi:hypothetical protein
MGERGRDDIRDEIWLKESNIVQKDREINTNERGVFPCILT